MSSTQSTTAAGRWARAHSVTVKFLAVLGGLCGILAAWYQIEPLQKSICQSSLFARLPDLAQHACRDEFRVVSADMADRQLSLLYGRAAGAGKATSWGMLAPETRETVPLEAWTARWKFAAFAERIGSVTPLDGFNDFAVRYRVYGKPSAKGSRIDEHVQHFQIRFLGDGQYSIRFFDNLSSTSLPKRIYPRVDVLLAATTRNSPVDGTEVGQLNPGDKVWLYCAIDIARHGSWARSSEGFVESTTLDLTPASLGELPSCDQHYAKDVSAQASDVQTAAVDRS